MSCRGSLRYDYVLVVARAFLRALHPVFSFSIPYGINVFTDSSIPSAFNQYPGQQGPLNPNVTFNPGFNGVFPALCKLLAFLGKQVISPPRP